MIVALYDMYKRGLCIVLIAAVNDICTIVTCKVLNDEEVRVVDLSQITNVSYLLCDNKDVYLMNQEDLLESGKY